MGCCGKKFGRQTYLPLNKRLLEYGTENTNTQLISKFSNTTLWMFTFIDPSEMCVECTEKFQIMVDWFEKFGLLKNPVKNVKWIFEDDMKNNLICQDMGLQKSPTHLLCDSEGRILDIVVGFPEEEWLEKHLLPYVQPTSISDLAEGVSNDE